MAASLPQHPVSLHRWECSLPPAGVPRQRVVGKPGSCQDGNTTPDPAPFWREVQLSSPLKFQRAEQARIQMAPPPHKSDGNCGAQRGAGPEAGNTATEHHAIYRLSYTPSNTQHTGQMSRPTRSLALHKDICLSPEANCSIPQDWNLGCMVS